MHVLISGKIRKVNIRNQSDWPVCDSIWCFERGYQNVFGRPSIPANSWDRLYIQHWLLTLHLRLYWWTKNQKGQPLQSGGWPSPMISWLQFAITDKKRWRISLMPPTHQQWGWLLESADSIDQAKYETLRQSVTLNFLKYCYIFFSPMLLCITKVFMGFFTFCAFYKIADTHRNISKSYRHLNR